MKTTNLPSFDRSNSTLSRLPESKFELKKYPPHSKLSITIEPDQLKAKQKSTINYPIWHIGITQNKTKQSNRICKVSLFHCAVLCCCHQLSIKFFFHFCFAFPITIIKTIILRHCFITEPRLKKCMQSTTYRNFVARRHKIHKIAKINSLSSSESPLSSHPTCNRGQSIHKDQLC